jgi:hypothetical protein
MIPDLHRSRNLIRSCWLQAHTAVALIFLLMILATPAPARQQPASAAAKPSVEAPKDAKPLKKAVREKKVITEDDLAKPAERVSLDDADEGEEISPLCDLSCEAELKAQVGFTPERELEFRNQLTFARHEISSDKAWNSMLDSAIHAAGLYCDLHRNKAAVEANRVVSKAARDEINLHYIEHDRDYASQYRNFEGQVTQRIAAIRRFAPFRATVMQYEWSTLVNRACPDVKLP